MTACNAAYKVIQNVERRSLSPTAEREAIVSRILHCLDLSQEPPSLREDFGKEAAVCLKEVLDRHEFPPESEIPGADAVAAADPPGSLDNWRFPHTDIHIIKVAEGPRQGEYLFSPDTVSRAREFFARTKHMPYRSGASKGLSEWYLSEPGWMIPSSLIRSLPGWAHARPLGQAVWQWTGLVLSLAAGLLVMVFIYRLGRRFGRQSRGSSMLHYSLTLLFPIAAMLVPTAVKYFVVEQLSVSGVVLAVTKMAADIVFLLAALVVLIGAGNRMAEIIIASPRINPKGIDAQFIRLVCRLLSLVAATVVFLEGGKYLGIPLTTLLAGAGVGGLAFALAAQDMLKNLFGSMMIILDKPYRVGERIMVKGYDGVVEEIGLRSTKMRLLTGHQTSIPNEEMARSDIENIGRRPHIRRVTNIPLPLDMSAEKAERAVEIVRGILDNHEGMEADFRPRIFFNDFNRDSLNLRMIYWYHPPNFWDFMNFSQQVNTEIMRQFEAEDIRMALPATTTVMGQDERRPLEFKVLTDPASEKDT